MNEKIDRSRQVGLGVLQPSEKDLAHGLELHEDATVCESYGFVPQAAPDRETIERAVESGMPAPDLQDLITELKQTRFVTDGQQQAEFKAAWDAAGVDLLMLCAGQEDQPLDRMLQRTARFTFMTDMMSDYVAKVASPAQALAAREAGRRCVMLTSNGVPLANRWAFVSHELEPLRLFQQLGCRMMHLTYNRRNMIGDGCAEPGNAGLSEFGIDVVREMNRLGVLVDLAHAGWQTCLDAARHSERPVVASHTGAHALYAHIRNKPDDVIRAICDTGGYVGIVARPQFLGHTGDVQALLDHVDYAVKLVGADHVAIGMDISYTAQGSRESLETARTVQFPERWYSLWPAGSRATEQWREPRMIESLAWTNWPLITVGLVQRGYKDDDIRKIIGGNVLRVLEAVQDDTPSMDRAALRSQSATA